MVLAVIVSILRSSTPLRPICSAITGDARIEVFQSPGLMIGSFLRAKLGLRQEYPYGLIAAVDQNNVIVRTVAFDQIGRKYQIGHLTEQAKSDLVGKLEYLFAAEETFSVIMDAPSVKLTVITPGGRKVWEQTGYAAEPTRNDVIVEIARFVMNLEMERSVHALWKWQCPDTAR